MSLQAGNGRFPPDIKNRIKAGGEQAMNTCGRVVDNSGVELNKRAARTAAGIAAFSVFLAGYALHPVWIFALSSLSIYLVTTAIIGEGPVGVLLRAVNGRLEDDLEAFDQNVGGWDRAARAAATAFLFAGVITGASPLADAVDYFVLTLMGFYAGTTSIIAWDPLYVILGFGTCRHPPGPVRAGAVKGVARLHRSARAGRSPAVGDRRAA